ncbi:hormogonium polysaccharide secretion pseudopilin HpsB [Scytonema millei]|uniref:Prepilin-type N-terminal cleavage/methylation domain-containing protein n=1 Tax=Scytonema millei VB511283 TaxID=1245923 RepID=A0A9X5E594_9CYAN|nr:hormogonium polysaccharide secretion pseudopilin HpsB [Scytonema millei]NHC34242.1 prepilin-type N-terminal cleavage/methylation domain-containing protein [Scytonema millei VB511283]
MFSYIHKQYFSKTGESGLTIIECLVAVLVVSVLMAAIAPAIALSVATRVQARRVERATQAARTYIDGLSAGTITAPTQTASLPFVTNASVPTGSSSWSCTTTATNFYCSNITASSLYCIDLDVGSNGYTCTSNSVNDFIVQAFRTSNNQNYLLGLRVYRADGFSDSNAFQKSDGTSKKTASTYTSGLGNRKAPLVEMITEISPDRPKYTDFCNRLDSSSTAPCKSNN